MCKSGKEKSGKLMARKLKQQVVIHPAEFSAGVAQFSSNDDFTIAFLTPLFQ
jgi:hypothetical protein